MKTEKTAFICLFLLALLFIVPACKGKQAAAPPKQEAATPGASTAAPAAPVEVKVEKEVYTYDPANRRDPFTSLVDVKPARTQKPAKGAASIETFDVEEIKLIAIAWDKQQSYAMVTLPDNKSYTLKKGMTLGLYGGKVREINRDSVIITEQIKDYKGQLKTKDTILKLRKEEEL
jgi:Tfp pilus assembly protein PilP